MSDFVESVAWANITIGDKTFRTCANNKFLCVPCSEILNKRNFTCSYRINDTVKNETHTVANDTCVPTRLATTDMMEQNSTHTDNTLLIAGIVPSVIAILIMVIVSAVIVKLYMHRQKKGQKNITA